MHPLPPIAPPLLAWYHANHRVLPFRSNPSPYHVWVSEIMLQQTRVTAALPYYERFIKELPTIKDLAECSEEKLHKLWEGLGYYSRVRNLQKAAQIVAERWGGSLPADYDALLGLPGIGEYTAGAIASIAFGLPRVAVDGNVLRVFSRLLASENDITLSATKRTLTNEVQRAQPQNTPGNYNQALMELGALICVPGTPSCHICPLASLCRAYKKGNASSLPVKPPKKAKRETPVCVFVVHCHGRVLLHQRPPKGLLANLWEPVLFEGSYSARQAAEKLHALLPGAKPRRALPAAVHVFTHRIWNLYGWECEVSSPTLPDNGYAWATNAQLQQQYALPGAFKAYIPFMLNHPAS